MSNNRIVDVLIIGAGPAGMAAALAASSAGADVLLVERDTRLGGILPQCIHNGFGLHRYSEELTGPEYAQRDIEALHHSDVEIQCGTFALELSQNDDLFSILLVSTGSARRQLSRSVVLAMGCRERTAGAISLPGARPAGIYTAGAAQRMMNIQNLSVGRSAVIVGSGDIGLIMARRMTLEGARVEAVTEIMPYPGGLARNVHQCLHDFGIPLYLSTGIADVYGRKRVEGVRIAPLTREGQLDLAKATDIACDTILLSVGLIPENELTRRCGVMLDPRTQGAMVDATCMTTVAGVFACGNVLHVHDVADHVTEEGALAGMAAAGWASRPAPASRMAPVACSQDIRYVVPQRITHCGKTLLSLRVSRVRPQGRLVVRQKDVVLASKAFIRLHPSEMVRLEVDIPELAPLEVSYGHE